MKLLSPLFLAPLALASSLAPAHATSPTVAVSARGANSAGCGAVASPCRTLQYALAQVDPGGDVTIIDSSEYGPLSITKAVNITYAGTGVALVQPAGAGKVAIGISAATSDTVRLRGLTIDGGGVGSNGVHFTKGGGVEIFDSYILNFTGRGIAISSPNSSFSITNTTSSNNGAYGFVAYAATGALKGVVDGLRLFSNVPGGMQIAAAAGATTDVIVGASVAMNHRSGTPGVGFSASGAGAKLTLSDSTTMDNLIGVQTAGGATLRLARSNLVGNGVAVAKPSGVVETFGDNIFRNTNDALATLTPVPLK